MLDMIPPWNERRALPARRYCETFEFSHEGVPYTASVGYYSDGTVGEVFLGGGKLTSAVDVAARDGAIAASIAMQFGAKAADLRTAFLRKPDGSPEGALGALMDLVAREEAP